METLVSELGRQGHRSESEIPQFEREIEKRECELPGKRTKSTEMSDEAMRSDSHSVNSPSRLFPFFFILHWSPISDLIDNLSCYILWKRIEFGWWSSRFDLIGLMQFDREKKRREGRWYTHRMTRYSGRIERRILQAELEIGWNGMVFKEERRLKRSLLFEASSLFYHRFFGDR